MRETSEAVDTVIFGALEPLKRQNPQMYKAVSTLPIIRKGLPKLRAHLARESYAICKKDESDNGWIDLAAAIALELNAMYYKNQVFDGKAGCSSSNGQSVIRNWSAESYSRGLALKILNNSYHNNRLDNLLTEADIILSIGEYRDTTQNIYSQTRGLSFDEQINLCNQRMYEINGSFIEKCLQMGAIAAGETNDSTISALSRFGRAHGMAHQIMNDISDFVPPKHNKGTTQKTLEDTYRDIKNGMMTYPIIWQINNGPRKDRDLIKDLLEEGQDAELSQLEKLTEVLVNNGAIDFAKRNVIKYRNEAKKNLHQVFSKKNREFLSATCTMFEKNRYYDALKKYKITSPTPLSTHPN